jgi:hypothetical protein
VPGKKRETKLVHHLIKHNLECLYCTHAPEKKAWFSEWNKDHHYKTFICENCGRKNFVRASFDGSGHDSFGELEKKLA